jgi:hypothetical protein
MRNNRGYRTLTRSESRTCSPLVRTVARSPPVLAALCALYERDTGSALRR